MKSDLIMTMRKEAELHMQNTSLCMEERFKYFLDYVKSYYLIAYEEFKNVRRWRYFLKQIIGPSIYIPGDDLTSDMYLRHWLYANSFHIKPEFINECKKRNIEMTECKFLPKGHNSYIFDNEKKMKRKHKTYS